MRRPCWVCINGVIQSTNMLVVWDREKRECSRTLTLTEISLDHLENKYEIHLKFKRVILTSSCKMSGGNFFWKKNSIILSCNLWSFNHLFFMCILQIEWINIDKRKFNPIKLQTTSCTIAGCLCVSRMARVGYDWKAKEFFLHFKWMCHSSFSFGTTQYSQVLDAWLRFNKFFSCKIFHFNHFDQRFFSKKSKILKNKWIFVILLSRINFNLKNKCTEKNYILFWISLWPRDKNQMRRPCWICTNGTIQSTNMLVVWDKKKSA